jgi:hypothetical protein
MPRCFTCHSLAPHIHEHHVLPRSMGGVGMVPLCEDCHGKIHGYDLRMSGLTKLALAKKKDRGERIGQIAYGFALATDGKTLIHNEEEQSILRLIRQERARGFTFRKIATRLAECGIKNRNGKPFNFTAVHKMFRGQSQGATAAKAKSAPRQLALI